MDPWVRGKELGVLGVWAAVLGFQSAGVKKHGTFRGGNPLVVWAIAVSVGSTERSLLPECFLAVGGALFASDSVLVVAMSLRTNPSPSL